VVSDAFLARRAPERVRKMDTNAELYFHEELAGIVEGDESDDSKVSPRWFLSDWDCSHVLLHQRIYNQQQWSRPVLMGRGSFHSSMHV